MGVALKDTQIKTQKQSKSRRRKKRRTEDVSSDSSSDSDDQDTEMRDVEGDDTTGKDHVIAQQQQTTTLFDTSANLDGINFNGVGGSQPVITSETKAKLSSINISNHNVSTANKEELLKVSQALKSEEQDLHNQFLVKMMKDYDTDIDELRVKPDFTVKSLPLLAKILKNGANLFDDESLRSILK